MKILFALLISFSLIGASSCVIVGPKHDNGKHKGWFKNPNNPHNPAHTTNPAPPKNNGNGNGKKKGK